MQIVAQSECIFFNRYGAMEIATYRRRNRLLGSSFWLTSQNNVTLQDFLAGEPVKHPEPLYDLAYRGLPKLPRVGGNAQRLVIGASL